MAITTLPKRIGVTLGFLEEFYYSIHIRDPTPDKLRASKIPDSLLVSIVVELIGKDGKKYSINHNTRDENYQCQL